MKRRRSQAGFTILEVLGAVLIMSAGLLTLVNVMNFAYRMQVTAVSRSLEWTVANAKVDEALGLPFEAFDDACNPLAFGTACNGHTNRTIGQLLTQTYPEDDNSYSEWSGTITTTNLDATGAAGGDGTVLRRIDINLQKTLSSGAVDFSDTFTIVKADLDDEV